MFTGETMKARTIAEEANKLKTKMNKSQAAAINWKIRLPQLIAFTGTSQLFDTDYRAKQQTHMDGSSPLWLKQGVGRMIAFVKLAAIFPGASLKLNAKRCEEG